MRQPMSVFEVKRERFRVMQVRLDKREEKLKERLEKLKVQLRKVERASVRENIAGLNGHLSYKDKGAITFEVREGFIYFYDKDGNEVN